ncbi:hypothetical protein GCM10010329_25120 [Streptomyces spiroverticillatus]|uniref:DUF3131 domain-containing protein n=1 Tax=Streptomyces finlayi TaxID=67296 RepID=A0A918WV72_9ACTN|nr:glucoamylase family protein [Streptomyces finlayi]GHA02247.1 hypothetical protein GCM10010329_25120 [Streptomyces spiroverticillatus]GHC86472.1 hypothetical protein GCM10010334_17540 [Streptomyces finlayi]
MTRPPFLRRPGRLRLLLAAALTTAVAVTGLSAPPVAEARAQEARRPVDPNSLTYKDVSTLKGYAADTWKSLEALISPETGLPASSITGDLKNRVHQTGPTPFGTYLWSATTAWKTGLISRGQARERVQRTLKALGRLDRHQESGMFYRWYDPYTGKLRDATPEARFVSSVDNAWAATGLMVVKDAFPELRREISPLLDRMDFRWFYEANATGANKGGGLMRGGFYTTETAPNVCTVKKRGVGYTCHFYGALGETRQVTYVAMALGQVPRQAYWGQNRSFADTECKQETRPTGSWRTYDGVKVWEGAYDYRGMKVMPAWGGSMFEAMMPNLFVPEEKWGRQSWAKNHPLIVKSQIEHGMDEAKYGYWGFSPSNSPNGGYRAYGVDGIGMDPDGYTSDQEKTTRDPGFTGCREGKPLPAKYGDGVVTPHASFLALRYAPRAALDNLAKLRKDFDVYGAGGFYDAVAVKSKKVSREYLTLDQGMVMAALGNALTGNSLRDGFVRGSDPVGLYRVKDVIAKERFASQDRRTPAFKEDDAATVRAYAVDTWKSMDAMVEPATGLPADNIGGDLSAASRSATTSPTNIGMYLWGAVTARDLGLITAADARARVQKVLGTLATMDHHEASGMYYNWFDPKTGHTLTTWPGNGNVVKPFLSSVDNAWLASALMVVRTAVPEAKTQAQTILGRMKWTYFYNNVDATPGSPAGLMRGGFWPTKPTDGTCTVAGNYAGDGKPDVQYTCHNYGAMGETRIVSYVGIASGQIPPVHYFGGNRGFQPTCAWAWQEQKPTGTTHTYLGAPVFEGTYSYRGMKLMPNWGGSMFEELMNDLVVPENKWAPDSWGKNHPVFVKAQIAHGMEEAKYGYWGFSPSNNPNGGYREYGVDAIGMAADGYTSDQEKTQVDGGFEGCREGKPAPTSYGDGVVTPHAAALAYRYEPKAALDNLAKLRADFDAYGPGGFYDAVAVKSGKVSKRYLALDQGMLLASFGNALTGDKLRGYFAAGEATTVLKPLLGLEKWESHS